MEGISASMQGMGAIPTGDYTGRSGATAVGQVAPSLSSIGACAADIRGQLFDRRDAVRHLADRGASLITKLSGSFPCPAPEKDPGVNAREPQSAIEAALREVQSISDPMLQMDASLKLLAMSFDALERSIG